MNGVAEKALAVQVLRNIGYRGGTATVHGLATDRFSRRRVRGALQLAAREGLVTSANGERYTLTQKARDAIAASEAATDQAEARAEKILRGAA